MFKTNIYSVVQYILNATIKKLENFIVDHNEKYNTDISSIFTQILHELHKPFDLMAAKQFIHTSKNVDYIRNENIFTTIPELECVREAVNEY
jgi:hypothetical protein